MLGADYDIGRFDPKMGLGKVIVSDHNTKLEYLDGEILVETEPHNYELRQIKINKWKNHKTHNVTLLGSTILTNDETFTSLVESVISYNFVKSEYWGTHDGVARGLPTKIFEGGKKSGEINWGLKNAETVIETKLIRTNLLPGTACNVTVTGDYTKMEGPYEATLTSYYADNSNSTSRTINAVVSIQIII